MNVVSMPMRGRVGSKTRRRSINKNNDQWMLLLTLLLLISISKIIAFQAKTSIPLPYGGRRRHCFTAALALSSKSELGFLSFDLDDTLFHTGKVVRAANQAMIATMKEYGCEDVTLPEYLETTRSVRKTLTGPITYRGLRELAIRTTFENSKTFRPPTRSTTSTSTLEELAKVCYVAWEQERHAAAERYLFTDCVETLEQLRSKYPDACIAAITNGAGNPLEMTNTISHLFDFRVSGEDSEVFPHRKPHAFIYEYSFEKYKQHRASQFDAEKAWLHVGDCLANDVSASADCGAKAIWMCLEDDDDSAASRLIDTKKIPEWSTAPKEEIEQRAKQIEEGKTKVTAKITNLSELPAAVASILLGATSNVV
jgi:FMN phosphatase YigB (HAD superfamily)